MSIIVTSVENKDKNNLEFPKLMSSDRNIILATGLTPSGFIIGTVIDGHSIGYHTSGWDPEVFKDFDGKMTLTNKS